MTRGIEAPVGNVMELVAAANAAHTPFAAAKSEYESLREELSRASSREDHAGLDFNAALDLAALAVEAEYGLSDEEQAELEKTYGKEAAYYAHISQSGRRHLEELRQA